MSSGRLVEALLEIDRRFEPASWDQPVELVRHRRGLTAAALSGATDYPDPFEYAAVPIAEYSAGLSEVERLIGEVDVAELRELVREHLDARRSFEAARRSGDEAYRIACEERYGLPGPRVMELSEQILQVPPPPVDHGAVTVRADQLRHMIRRALDNYGLDDWLVEESDNLAARMSVNASLRRLRIRAGATFDVTGARRLVLHEVGGHVLRSANSWSQPEHLARIALGRHVETEEGLALWLEQEHGLMDRRQMRIYAARALAVRTASRTGILEVIRTLVPLVGLETSVEIALRVKRGLRDPNQPGGLTKDHGYLSGLMRISEMHNRERRLRALAVTKWSADHLDLAESLLDAGILRPARYQPELATLRLAE